jgi:alpha-galactosidase
MMSKITIIGAGSAEFSTEIVRDVLATPALEGGTFGLVDIHTGRLELAQKACEKLITESGRNWKVEASLDRRDILPGTDYVVNTIEVAGRENVRHDYDIPLKYGVDQCIGDTIGPGGLFKALRTLPAWIDILRDVEDLAPDSLVMNFTNPMSLTVLAGVRSSGLPIVGLCHSIQHTSHTMANYMQIPYEEIDWRAAGINHQAWFVKLERDGEDLYPLLREKAENPEIYDQDPVRFEIMRHLGAFCTEGSGHDSEYVPYFRKRPDLVKKYDRSGYIGESGFYANNWPTWVEESAQGLRDYLAGKEAYDMERGEEFASFIIEAMETGVPAVVYGNVPNTGLIDNLPQDGVVEVACLVDNKGVQPTHFGRLPTQLAALNKQHMAFHDLVATSVLEQDREAAVHALMIDPLTAAVCSLEEIRMMFDEMVEAQRDYLPKYIVE